MEGPYRWFYSQTSWLYIKLFENGLFFINYWSFVHLWGGIVIFMIISASKVNRKWLWLFCILLLIELPEVVFLQFSNNSVSEIIKDKAIEIIAGLLGSLICYRLIILKPVKTFSASVSRIFQMGFISFTFAFIWVESYDYHYNMASLNTPGLNLWAFFLWGIGGYYIIEGYLFFKKRVENKVILMILVWVFYFMILLIIEFTGYHFMHIAEISSSKNSPLIFGLIHGSFWLHLYYIISPFLIVSFYEIFIRISALAKEETSQTVTQ